MFLPGRRDDRGKTIPELVGQQRYRDAVQRLWPQVIAGASIVHIKRHPASVLASHLDQTWAPSTVDGVLAYLKPIYQRWLGWKDSVDLTGRRYIEVKAEDLAADWPGQRRALFERLGVEDFATPSEFQAHRLSNRDSQFDDETRRYIQKDLGRIIHAMGYE